MRELPITAAQATLVASLERAVATAADRLALACSAIAAGHDDAAAVPIGIGGTPEAPTLLVRLPSSLSG